MQSWARATQPSAEASPPDHCGEGLMSRDQDPENPGLGSSVLQHAALQGRWLGAVHFTVSREKTGMAFILAHGGHLCTLAACHSPGVSVYWEPWATQTLTHDRHLHLWMSWSLESVVPVASMTAGHQVRMQVVTMRTGS